MKNSDVVWKNDLAFYSIFLDDIKIENNKVIVTHYESDAKSNYFLKDMIYFDKLTGNIINYKKAIDTLNQSEIENKKNYNKYANRLLRPIYFKINPMYELNLNVDISGSRHHKTRSFEFEIKLNDEVYFLNLDNFDLDQIDFYLQNESELYIFGKPDYDFNTLPSSFYKFEIIKIIKNHNNRE